MKHFVGKKAGQRYAEIGVEANHCRLSFVGLSFLLISFGAAAAELYEAFPDTINPDERYVIYSHGFIVEGTNPRPEHPQLGIYDFPAIKQALFEDGGFNLIAHHRTANTDIGEYIDTLAGWIGTLLDEGVPASRITLIGFSRGALLTAHASGRYEGAGLNTALMAICSNGSVSGPRLSLGGNFLSIYEKSDAVGTCRSLAEASPNLDSFRQIEINTRLSHGAFFRPIPEWVLPLREWISETNR